MKFRYLFFVVLVIIETCFSAQISFTDTLTATSVVSSGSGSVSWSNIGNIISPSTTDYAKGSSFMSKILFLRITYSTASGDKTPWAKLAFTIDYRGMTSGITIVGFQTTLTAACDTSYESFQLTAKLNTPTLGDSSSVTASYTTSSKTSIQRGSNADLWGYSAPVTQSQVASLNLQVMATWTNSIGYPYFYSAPLTVTWQATVSVDSFSPTSSNTLNPVGVTLTITGNNFYNTGYGVKCQVGASAIQTGTIVSLTTVTCPLPPSSAYGNQLVGISLDNGATWSQSPSYFNYQCNATQLCNSHGTCGGSGTCSCFSGWKGNDCATPDCSQFNDCNSHGYCIAGPSCVCNGDWIGASCSQPSCIAVNNCSNHGYCSAPRTCVCDDGYLGTSCNLANCSTVNECNSVNNGGSCVAPQTCSCNSGYSAPDCAASCTSVTCTGNQFCGQTNNCTFCKLPYQNPPICDQQCEQKKIVTANFSGNCNGQARCNERGSCIAQDTCDCDPGWIGSNCGQPDCRLQYNCSSHGTCVSPNTCNCIAGWKGGDCNTTDCPLADGCNSLNGGGMCIGPNTCQCSEGWVLPNCTTFSCTPFCGINAQCVGPNTCECLPGYVPPLCQDKYDCSSLNDCNGNGFCAANLTCTCLPGYFPPDCKLADCISYANCSGSNGFCASPGNCTCLGDWSGVDCSVKAQVVAKANLTPIYIGVGAGGGGLIAIGAAIFAGIGFRRYQRKKRFQFVEPNYTQTVFGKHLILQFDAKESELDYLKPLYELLTRADFGLPLAMSSVVTNSDRDNLSRSLVHVLSASALDLLPLMKKLIDMEVENAQSEATLFRANSMAVSMFQVFAKIFGIRYLWRILGSFLVELNVLSMEDESKNGHEEGSSTNLSLTTQNLSMEVDPNKVDDDENVAVNKYVLLLITQKLFTSITSRVNEVPVPIRVILKHLEQTVRNVYVGSRYKSLGAFMFLRFIVPCVTTPHVYGIFEEPPGDTAQRRLTLLAKVLQNLANEVNFGKEPHMASLNDFIVQNLDELHAFFDKLLQVDNKINFGAMDIPTTVKNNALLFLHTYCHGNLDKIVTELTNAGLEKTAQELKDIVKSMPEPAATKPQ